MAIGLKQRMAAFVVAAFACVGLTCAPTAARAVEGDYQIYPTPHSITYAEGEQTLRSNVTAVIEDGIDADTINRMDEALALKGSKATEADEIPAGKGTAVLVGVKDSGGAVDKRVDELTEQGKLTVPEDLFTKTDAYLLASLPSEGNGPDQVIVLGKDTDSAYYGLTTLFQILQQAPGAKLRAFTVADYADVITRGFIEGYYGNPWSTEDRVALMEWGGYYKLNAYFYAPKDDPKHNSAWREKYSDEEIETKIKPLAEAGNKSKTRFIFALHPFMHNPITKDNYSETLELMKSKFLQVIDAGVRQIAILGDDAKYQLGPNESEDADKDESKRTGELYIMLLDDTTEWLRGLQQEKNEDGTPKYPGLKDTLIFCPVSYMGFGEAWYKDLPDNVQVINTGGRIWGKIDNAFATEFQENSKGVAPFMWINWPCSDNDKDALHMGGHNSFLGSDLTPGQVEGVVLNPMQQSEPSKQAIFMNADFTWNLWTSTEHADQAWEDSFSYIDHNSPNATKGSKALRDLAVHMRRMYGGGTAWESGESANIKDELNAFRAKLTAGTVSAEDAESMAEIFAGIQQTAKDFRANAGTERMLKQMEPWMATWDDLTRAALEYLEALDASLAGDDSALLEHYSAAQTAFDSANGHGFHYIDHTEYARVGKAHITPFVNALAENVAERATLAADPDANIKKFITSRTDTPAGSIDAVMDGDPATGVSFKTPDSIAKDTYIGFEQTQPFDLDRFTITYDKGHLNDTIRTGKVQVLKKDDPKAAGEWQDVAGKTISNNRTQVVDFTELGQKGVYGVRLIATAANEGACWLTVNEIEINKVDVEEPETSGPIPGVASLENCVIASGDLGKVTDGDPNTNVALKRNGNDNTDPTRDQIPAGAAVKVTFAEPAQINKIYYKQTARTGNETNSGDGLLKGKIQYLPASVRAAEDAWIDVADVDGSAEYNVTLDSPVTAQAIRVVNSEDTKSWWNVFELSAEHVVSAGMETITGTVTIEGQENADANRPLRNASDNNDATEAWLTHKSANPGKDDATDPGATVIVTFDGLKSIDTIVFKQGLSNNGGDVIESGVASYQDEAGEWHEAGAITSASSQSIELAQPVQAKAIKVENKTRVEKWWRVAELHATRGEAGEQPMGDPSVSTNLTQYQENPISNVIDGDESTKFWSNGGSSVGSYILYAFGGTKTIDTVRILQGAADNFAAADVLYTTDAAPAPNGNWTKVGTFGNAADQSVEFDPVKATGIKVQATAANSNWLQVFELEAYEQHAYSADNIIASEGVEPKGLTARVGGGAARVKGGAVALPQVGDFVAVDLGSVRRDMAVGEFTAPAGTELVVSQNALEWTTLAADTLADARFIGLRATTANVSANLNGLVATYLDSLEPRVVKSDLPGEQTLDASKVFDNDVTTATKSSGGPAAGNTVVFDLGQERTIMSLEYFVPETSLDPIRNAVVEVAATPDATEWSQVLDINSENIIPNGEGKDLKAKECDWLTHSSTFPGNMMVGSGAIEPVTGRYLRIRFTGTYTARWVEIGELRINNGEYVSTYVGADFESSVAEQKGMSPANMLDKDMNTAWAPLEGKAGALTYHVSSPIRPDGNAVEGVRIISRGTPSGATVKAVMYTDDTYSATEEATLGTIEQVSQEFRFGTPVSASRAAVEFTAVKDIVIEWPEGTTPQISEIYLLAKAPAAVQSDVEELNQALAAAQEQDTSTWTKDSMAALDAAIASAKSALENPDALTASVVASLVARLQDAVDTAVAKYAGTELMDLVTNAIEDGSAYTEASWNAYRDALAAASEALKDADNLSDAFGTALADAIKQAKDALAFNSATADRAVQMVEDCKDIYAGGTYTGVSKKSYDDALAALSGLVDAGKTDPAVLKLAMDALDAACKGLVDVSALIAERAEFDKHDPKAYTSESFAAYKQAYEDSADLLENGTAEQIAEAVDMLQSAKAGLKPLDLDALIAECEKLDENEYTKASWSAFADALENAKEGKGGADAQKLAQELVDAKAALVNAVALKDAIARAEGIDESRYTAESVAKLKAAVEDAADELERGSVESVEAARQAILAALDGLVADGGDQGGTGGQGGQGGTGGQDGQSGTGSQGGTGGADDTDKPGGSLPGTGDATMARVAMVGAAGLMAVAAAGALRRRESKN